MTQLIYTSSPPRVSAHAQPHPGRNHWLAALAAIIVLGLAAGPKAEAEVVIANLVSFDNTNSGNMPSGKLLQTSDGNFYGTVEFGAANRQGAVYRLSPDGTYTNLVIFNGTNGASPNSGVIQGMDGNLYGTTLYGGAYTSSDSMLHLGYGTVFSLNRTNSQFTSLSSFNNIDGGSPNALLEVTPGVFYGTANTGGSSSNQFGFSAGTLFKADTNGFLTNIFSFNDTNGVSPSAPLLMGPNGKLYGTTTAGGSNEDGTAFTLDTNNVLTTLLQFADTNGSSPIVLLLGQDGSFYGTTVFGGAYHFGTLFKLSPGNVLTTIATFNGTNGYSPSALIQGADGNLYGTTTQGGASGYGTVFQLTTNGVLTTLYSFTGGSDGRTPNSLMQAADGNFYGSTSYGGNYGFGNIFKLTIVPAPVLQITSKAAGTLSLSWNAAVGVSYQVQYLNNLLSGYWLNLTNVTATSTIASASTPIGPDLNRFYRVIAELAPPPGN